MKAKNCPTTHAMDASPAPLKRLRRARNASSVSLVGSRRSAIYVNRWAACEFFGVRPAEINKISSHGGFSFARSECPQQASRSDHFANFGWFLAQGVARKGR